jgi:PiT family inorganic phosphate transporter
LIELITAVALLAAFYVCWNIGANDSANVAGAAVGGRLISYRRAIAIIILFVVLGAVLEGWKNMKTVGEGVVSPVAGVEENPFHRVPVVAVSVLFAAGIWVMCATMFGLPVSTSQSMIGAVLGGGLLISFMQPEGVGTVVRFGKVGGIALSWIISIIAASVLAYVIYRIFGSLMRRVKNLVLLNRIFVMLVTIAAAYSAYAIGANDVGASTGVLYAVSGTTSLSSIQIVGLFGGVAVAVGAITYSRKVMRTVGTGITRLDALGAFAAQVGAALVVHSFVQFGIPVSTSQAIVGGVIGVGLVKGVIAVDKRKLGEIGVAWILTPFVTCLLAFLLGMLFLWV